MSGLGAIIMKELADHLSSRRFWILFFLIYLSGIALAYVGVTSLKGELMRDPVQEFVFLRMYTYATGASPPFLFFVLFFGPIIGLILGFDAINRELSSGTLGRVLSQPVYRDSVINGKFLAGLITIGIMVGTIVIIIGGMGMKVIGSPPTVDEVLRITIFAGISVIYMGLWLSLGLLFSIIFRRIATSSLASMAVWLFFTFFTFIIADIAANTLVPVGQAGNPPTPEMLVANEVVRRSLMRTSPITLFEEISIALLNPKTRTFSPLLFEQAEKLAPTPLPLSQSLLLVWPHITSLAAGFVILFAISYAKFMRKEIRPGWA